MHFWSDVLYMAQIVLGLCICGGFCVGFAVFFDRVSTAYHSAVIDLPLVIRRK